MRATASRARRSTTPGQSDVTRLQQRLAFRLLLVFLVPLAVIVVLGVYAYRLSARLREVEMLERVSHVDQIYTDTHNVPWARREYEALAARYPSNHGIFVRLGALYQEDGQPALAIKYLRDAIRLKPDDWEAYSTLAYVELSRKNDVAAIAAGEAALRYNETDVQAYNNLAWIYATSSDQRLRDPAKAVKYAERAVGYTRCRKRDYLDTLAETYRQSGQPDQAQRIPLAGTTKGPLCGPPEEAMLDPRTKSVSAATEDGAGRRAITAAATLGR